MQYWSYDSAPKTQQQQYGWNTTSNDYHSHISKLERMPGVLNEVPRYPNVHKAFKNNYTCGDQEQESSTQQHQKKSSPKAQAQKKVQVTDERVEIVESAKDDKNFEVREDSIDFQADGFIQRKRKGFELCKWNTFKLY